jgi:ABC-type multidrug transport system fused ATPase/permease subunit
VDSATDFALTDRGPFDRVVRPAKPIALRAILLALLAWLPLLVLSLAARRAGPDPRISFFDDIGVHVRFLVVVPLLILAEIAIGQRTRTVAQTFLGSGLVRSADRGRFDQIVMRVTRRVDSVLVEVALLAVAVVSTSLMVQRLLHDGVVFWFEHVENGVERLSPAGWWYVVMVPVVGFLFLRWVWRYATWCWFLKKVSKLDLHLVATHADRSGGLGFIKLGQNTFAAVPLAASCIVAASAGTEILQAGATLMSYKNALIAFVIVSIIVGMLPFPIFFKSLAKAKRDALVEYGKLSTRYSQAFEGKWMHDGAGSEELLGSGDFQSLADLGGAYERLDSMRASPLDKRTVIAFAVAAIVPMLPLVLTVMPLKEILKVLMKAMV